MAAAVALGGLTLIVPLAVPAGAATDGVRPAPQPAICARARSQWARLADANRRARRAFQRAEALQARLLRAGRSAIAHRLDTRLRYLRQVHTLIVTRVATIAAKAAGVCSGRPPVLAGL
ncbi:MAG TPA: hypothetical protein VG869_17125 [Acidimicrobiia bacterium]|nr:hypothetical protein [Acidimicrobiia bacterium]